MHVRTALARLPDDVVVDLGHAAFRELPAPFRPPLHGRLRVVEARVIIAAAVSLGGFPEHPADWGPPVVMALWPRTVAHVIAGSLGYATPTVAALIVADAHAGRRNWCEWIDACYGGDTHSAVRSCVRGRHAHRGAMTECDHALVWCGRPWLQVGSRFVPVGSERETGA